MARLDARACASSSFNPSKTLIIKGSPYISPSSISIHPRLISWASIIATQAILPSFQ
ncbi:uncharacterized protein PGTG_21024, partial [Puccinia graminis f. sp. tritici CRL 75-36-700-3]